MRVAPGAARDRHERGIAERLRPARVRGRRRRPRPAAPARPKAFASRSRRRSPGGRASPRGPRARSARLIVVLGPKGGTGKTLTATNLAVALAEAGKQGRARRPRPPVRRRRALHGPEPRQDDLRPRPQRRGARRGEARRRSSPTHESGVKVLLAPSRPDQASVVTVEFLRDVYAVLRRHGTTSSSSTRRPGFTPEVIASIDMSTDLVMVGMLDSLSLKNTKLGLETLELMGYPSEHVTLVLNRAGSRVGISDQRRQPRPRARAGRPRAERPRDPAARSTRACRSSPRSPAPRRPRRSASWPRCYIGEEPELEVPETTETESRSPPPQHAVVDSGGGVAMDLHERLTTARPVTPVAAATRHAELKNQVHLKVIGELGPQLFDPTIDPRRAARASSPPTSAGTSPRRSGSRATSASGSPTRSRTTSSATGRSSGCSPTTRSREIMVNGPNEIWIERQGRLYETTVRFTDDSHLRRIINKIVAPGRPPRRRVVADGRRAPARTAAAST